MDFYVYTRRGLSYSYLSGANMVHSWEDAEARGLNCGALAQLLLQDLFQISFRVPLLPFESYWRTDLLQDLAANDSWETGDLFFFSSERSATELAIYTPDWDTAGNFLTLDCLRDHPHLHIAVYTGEVNEVGEPRLIHATPAVNGVAIWPLSRFETWICYEQLLKVRRLKLRP